MIPWRAASAVVAVLAALAGPAALAQAPASPIPASPISPGAPALARPIPQAVLPSASAGLVKPAVARRSGHPLPPRRPAEFARADAGTVRAPAADNSAAPVVATAFAPGPPATAVARNMVAALPANPQDAVAQLNAYFNSITTLVGDFVQFGADGRRAEGVLYLQKPGRIRFEYKAPATLEVVADGQSVAIRDRKLATQDLVSLAQTPLKFLLNQRIDLARDTKVLKVQNDANTVRVTIEDRTTLGGTSRITLIFDPRENVLKQWVVVDPQGYETSVALYNLDTSRRPDPKLFRINYERVIDTTR